MKYEIMLLGLLALIMVGGLAIHLAYLRNTYKRVGGTYNRSKENSDIQFDMAELKESLQLFQGSNFNIFIIAAWSLFFIAIAFLYLLSPVLPFNYFEIPFVASYKLGLLILSISVILVTALAAFSLPMIYRYYVIHRRIKILMAYLLPLLLLFSISFSAYLATMYPEMNPRIWNISYFFLASAEVLLILPFLIGFREGSR
jgi:hypothetical protein